MLQSWKPWRKTSSGNSPASHGMAIKSGFGGGTGSSDLEQRVPGPTLRSTVLYIPASNTFFVVFVAEAGAEAITDLYEASRLPYQFLCLVG